MEGGHSLLERMLLDKNAEPTDIQFSLLKFITNDFSDAQQIGCGGFAVVYKGRLENGAVVAVKKLSNSISMDEKKYNQEVSCLMRVKHRNIVRFLGYCADTQGKMLDYKGKFVMADVRERLLCFEYVRNGTLRDYIADASTGLDWGKRYRIIKGICEGLHYLHEKGTVHLDLKPANILLDDNMVPKIADFGISKCFDQEESWATASKLVGTLGYLAPESSTRKITRKLDIYSLGVIITEILTGQKGYSSVENVLESWSNRLKTSSAIDTVLKQIRICSDISIDCMDLKPEKRPTTQHIIELLEQTECMDDFKETDVQTAQILEGPLESKDMHCIRPRKRRSSAALALSLTSEHCKEAPLEATRIRVLLELTESPSCTTEGAGLDLVVVLGVSRSMKGIKMEQLKSAMQFVIKKMRPSRNRLCIVTFSGNKAIRLCPLRVMSEAAKSDLQLIVNGLEAAGGGGADIWDGIKLGAEVLGDRRQTHGRSANILVVSDGEEISSGHAWLPVYQSNVSVYTVAFGARVFSVLQLWQLATNGGTFNMVPESSRGMGLLAVFSQLLAGLQTVVATDLCIILSKPCRPDVDLCRIHNFTPSVEEEIDSRSGEVTLRLGNLFSGEARKVVVDLFLIKSTGRDYETDILDVTVNYNNAQLGVRETFRIPTLYVARTAAATAAVATRNLQAELARLQHADYIRDASWLADDENLEGARSKLAKAQNALNLLGYQADPMLAILRAELTQLLDRMESQELYQEEGRPYALASDTSHARQRFAARGDVRLFATPCMDTYLQQAKQFADNPDTPLPTPDGTPLPITDEEDRRQW